MIYDQIYLEEMRLRIAEYLLFKIVVEDDRIMPEEIPKISSFNNWMNNECGVAEFELNNGLMR
jgi:hypothetical protein